MTRDVDIAMQVTIVFIGGTTFQVTHIRGCEWGISPALGFVSIPLVFLNHGLLSVGAMPYVRQYIQYVICFCVFASRFGVSMQ